MKITGNKEKYCDRDSIPSEKYADGRPQGPGADPSGSFGENTPALADAPGFGALGAGKPAENQPPAGDESLFGLPGV